MKKLIYKGSGIYPVYSDIYLDIMRRGDEGYIFAEIVDQYRTKIRLSNLLAMKKLRDKLTEIIKKNPSYFKRVGE